MNDTYKCEFSDVLAYLRELCDAAAFLLLVVADVPRQFLQPLIQRRVFDLKTSQLLLAVPVERTNSIPINIIKVRSLLAKKLLLLLLC